MDFDKLTDRRGTLCAKWDGAAANYNIPEDGLPMWVADTDFEVPEVVTQALQSLVDHRIFGYQSEYTPYKDAIRNWMAKRHGWQIEHDEILTTFGLVNAIGIALDAYTKPGDGIVVFTPVYHAFMRVIRAAGRKVVEVPLSIGDDGRFQLDQSVIDATLTGDEKMIIWCSPHNPGGRIWTRDELEVIAALARDRDMLLISDEIHHDIVMPGHKHTPMALIDGISDRLLMMTAVSKTFNLAGHHSGNVIITDEDLRNTYRARQLALGISSSVAGIAATTAAYSDEGAAYADAMNAYVAENVRVFSQGVGAIPGVKVMPLEATYLVWVDFRGLGMDQQEITRRVEEQAGIAANHGPTFGKGGEGFMRFNMGTQRVRVEDAVQRLQTAFADLQ